MLPDGVALPDGIDAVVFVVGGGGVGGVGVGIAKIISATVKSPLRPPTSALT